MNYNFKILNATRVLWEMQPFPYVLALLNSFMNFGGDIMVVIVVMKREDRIVDGTRSGW